ncbi:MAG: hypothetical protein J4G00_10670 [Actinomycetia bacterium]|nr:hypothetical protein [Actinomycetes bacterium]
MTRFPILLRILAVAHLLMAAFGLLVGSFADGGQWWERAVLTAVHPVAAVFLLVLVMSGERTQRLINISVSLLLLNVIADVVLSLAIATGASRGDWWLPLVFSVIPLVAVVYCLPLLRRS